MPVFDAVALPEPWMLPYHVLQLERSIAIMCDFSPSPRLDAATAAAAAAAATTTADRNATTTTTWQPRLSHTPR
ncbi:hypothetical protein J1614_010771 [Plenodomus biglobosus]|nr:hypothetical protein J1614_010771 [Plenodomus biglobosus]